MKDEELYDNVKDLLEEKGYIIQAYSRHYIKFSTNGGRSSIILNRKRRFVNILGYGCYDCLRMGNVNLYYKDVENGETLWKWIEETLDNPIPTLNIAILDYEWERAKQVNGVSRYEKASSLYYSKDYWVTGSWFQFYNTETAGAVKHPEKNFIVLTVYEDNRLFWQAKTEHYSNGRLHYMDFSEPILVTRDTDWSSIIEKQRVLCQLDWVDSIPVEKLNKI